MNYFITQSRQKSRQLQLEFGRSYRRDVVRKATPGRRGSGPLIELGSREVADKMQERKPSSSRDLGPRASGWASGEQERHNVDGHKSGGQNIEVSVRSPAPSQTQTLSNLFEPLQIKWEVYFVKEVFTRRLLQRRYVYNTSSYTNSLYNLFFILNIFNFFNHLHNQNAWMIVYYR